MPKIPWNNQLNQIRHQNLAVHASGGPGGGFGMEKAQSFRQFGEEIRNAGAQIGSAVTRFSDMRRDAENKLASTQARNLFRSMQTQLNQRMADHPEDSDLFEEWARETDQKFEEESRKFTGKMTWQFKNQFETEMSGIRDQALQERLYILNQALTQKNYDLFQSEWKDAAIRGDLSECTRMLSEHRGTLISEQEYQQKMLDYQRLSAFGEVKREVEAGSPGIIGRLKERSSDGQYKNYTGLEESARDSFIRLAEANDAKKRTDENQQLLDRLNNGEQISVEDIDRFFEGQTAPEAVRQKNQQRRIVQQFAKAHAEAKKQAEREAAQEAREVEREKQKKRSAEINEHEYRILTYDFSPDPARRQIQYSELKNEIFTKYPNDGATVKKLTTQLDEVLNAKVKPDSSYKNSYIYIKAKYMLSDMEKAFYSRYPGRGESWYSFATNVYNNSSELEKSNYKMAEVQLDNFIRENPSATEQDVRLFLDTLKRDVNWAECDKLIQFWTERITPHIANSSISSGEAERMVNGRIAIFGEDHKFIRWKDSK